MAVPAAPIGQFGPFQKASLESTQKSTQIGEDLELKERVLDPKHPVIRTQTAVSFVFVIVKLALQREQFGSEKLKRLSGEVTKQLESVDLLIDLSRSLTDDLSSDKESNEIPPKTKKLLQQLEARKIQVWTGGDKISQAQLAELKARVNSQVDQLRSSLQTTISTQIQPEISNLQAIMNIVQQILRLSHEADKRALELQR